jgi:uncharacterized RDD family membrane protein YckC
MYIDQMSGLLLPEGTELASVGRRIGAYFLAIPLAIITLGIGYIIWGLIVWGNGQTPALQVLGMRCWRPETNRVAGFWYMALREIPGRIIDGMLSFITLITSFVLMCTGKERKALHDWIAGTVVLPAGDLSSRGRWFATVRRVPDAGTLPSVIRFPSALDDAVAVAETLRHGPPNAATGGIWRVRGTEGSAILKTARLSAASELLPDQSQVGHTHVDRITALPPPWNPVSRPRRRSTEAGSFALASGFPSAAHGAGAPKRVALP